MTVQMATRLTLRTFKHKKRKVTNIRFLTNLGGGFEQGLIAVGCLITTYLNVTYVTGLKVKVVKKVADTVTAMYRFSC